MEVDRIHWALTAPRTDGLPRDIIIKPHYYRIKEKMMFADQTCHFLEHQYRSSRIWPRRQAKNVEICDHYYSSSWISTGGRSLLSYHSPIKESPALFPHSKQVKIYCFTLASYHGTPRFSLPSAWITVPFHRCGRIVSAHRSRVHTGTPEYCCCFIFLVLPPSGTCWSSVAQACPKLMMDYGLGHCDCTLITWLSGFLVFGMTIRRLIFSPI